MGGVGVTVYTDNRCVEGYIPKAPPPSQQFIKLQFGPVTFNKDSSQHVTTGVYILCSQLEKLFQNRKTLQKYSNNEL